ncbi:hypothetical protein JMJ77_0001206, partial [Colletotrichum scovillei]
QEAGRYGCSPPDSLSRNLPAVFHHFSWVTKKSAPGCWESGLAHSHINVERQPARTRFAPTIPTPPTSPLLSIGEEVQEKEEIVDC